MAVSTSRDHFDYTTEFAAVEAPAVELVAGLSKLRGFKENYALVVRDPVPVDNENTGLVVVYSFGNSAWTIIDPILSRLINLGAIYQATEELNTQALSACFCRNTGAFGYSHVKNGMTVEDFCCTEPDFHQYSPDEARQNGWQLDSGGYRRLKTNRQLDVDLDITPGFSLLSALSDELGLEIPAVLNWDVQNGKFTIDSEQPLAISSAYLLHLS